MAAQKIISAFPQLFFFDSTESSSHGGAVPYGWPSGPTWSYLCLETPGANESLFALGTFPSPCTSIKMPADENNFQHTPILLVLKLQRLNSSQLHDGFLNLEARRIKLARICGLENYLLALCLFPRTLKKAISNRRLKLIGKYRMVVQMWR